MRRVTDGGGLRELEKAMWRKKVLHGKDLREVRRGPNATVWTPDVSCPALIWYLPAPDF